MISKEEGWLPEDLKVEDEPLRWKLLIVVIDCSYGPRLHNPPRSIRALKAKLAAALGIEALSKQTGTSGAQAASAQAIVTGVEGPKRHLLEQDDDLCGFWDRVATGPGVEEPEEARRISKTLTVPASTSPNNTLRTRSNSRSSQQALGLSGATNSGGFNSQGLNRQVSALSSGPSPVPVPVLPVGGPAVPLPSMPVPMPVLMPRASTEMRPETREHRSSGIDLSVFESQIRQLEERCEDAELKLADCMQQLETSKAELEVVEDELEGERRANNNAQAKIAELEELSAQLQEQNLGFIKTFEQQLENARKEIKQEVVDSYQSVLDSQAKKVHEADGYSRRVEGQLRVALDKIKDLEAALRHERGNAQRSEAALAGEHAKIEQMAEKIQSQAARLRQLEWYANSWYRKVQELADESATRAFAEPPNFYSFTVCNFTTKLRKWPKGHMVQNPEFMVEQLGETQIEFFPAGEVNSRPGWCSLRLRIPDGGRLRWRVKIGAREFDVRDDHYDSRQWWNRYGIQCLNFCQVDELLPEVLPESNTALIGIEVLEVLTKPQEVPRTAFTGASPEALKEEPKEPKVPSSVLTKERPGTAPQRVEPRRPSAPAQVVSASVAALPTRDTTSRSQPQLPVPKAAHGVAAGTASAAAAAAAFAAVKSGNLPPAVAVSRGLHRQRSHGALRSKPSNP